MEQETVGETNTNNSEGGHTLNINNAGSPRCYPGASSAICFSVSEGQTGAGSGAGRGNARVALKIEP